MVTQIGRSTDPSTKDHRDDIPPGDVASFRYNNPGAQFPSARAALFGQTGFGMIGGNNKIARFPSPVNGAASNFDLLSKSYVGMSIGEAGRKWTGEHSFGVPGFNPSLTLTMDMLDDSAKAIPFLKAIAHRESGKGNNLTEEQWRQAHQMFKLGSADAFLDGLPPPVAFIVPPGTGPSGASMVQLAQKHLGEEYVNIRVPKDDPNWHGPWDCAEFASWLVFQELNKLYGCIDDSVAPDKADAFTGSWKTDLEKMGKRISVEEAAATPGAFVLRYPPGPGKMGHIALCTGDRGGTIEAKGRRFGVIRDTVEGRSWDAGILIPGIAYGSGPPIKVNPPMIIYKINAPNMDKVVVTRIKQALTDKNFDPGRIDGDFDRNTQLAVLRFQEAEGLTVDGEVGPETAEALGISLLNIGGGVVGPMPDVPFGTLPLDPQQLLAFILMLLSKEKPMPADPAKPGQGLELLLPLLLSSALSGKQLDLTQIIAVLTTGKPLVTPPTTTLPAVIPPANTVPAVVVQGGQAQNLPVGGDLLTLLLPILFERLTGKPLPGTEPPPKTDAPAATPNPPVMSRPSVQLSAGLLGIVSILQALGQVGLPFNLGALAGLPASSSTPNGTLATLIPLVIGGIGATGGWGALAGIAAKLFGGLLSGLGKKA